MPSHPRVLAGAVALSVLLGLPAEVRAHACEEEIAKTHEWLAIENRNLAMLELSTRDPRVQLLRSNYNYRLMLFLQAQAECAQAVREEHKGGEPATGCGKDVDCKGNRICVSGSCVDP
ncbi:MAG: hypothetical protein RJA59_295 [Pseudomonadota bacterium]|jgi:hypothetical protein